MNANNPRKNKQSNNRLVVDNAGSQRIVVSIVAQELQCWQGQQLIKRLPISSAKRGAGQQQGSFQTPLGEHVIRAKIGAEQPEGAVFVGRRPTGEVWCDALDEQFPGRDWILTRILWLSGKQPGHNRLGNVDSMRRFIYIHGTPSNQPIGVPASHGCLRMTNTDILWLFDWANLGTSVLIQMREDNSVPGQVIATPAGIRGKESP